MNNSRNIESRIEDTGDCVSYKDSARKIIDDVITDEESTNKENLQKLYCDFFKGGDEFSASHLFLKRQLLGKGVNFDQLRDEDVLENIGSYLGQLLDIGLFDMYKSTKSKFGKGDMYSHLFIWAILTDKTKLALYFIKETESILYSALIATALLNELSQRADRDCNLELLKRFKDEAKLFEKIACEIVTELNNCYSGSKMYHILTRKHDMLGSRYKTLITFADHYNIMDFIATTACQSLVNNTWKGKLSNHTTNIQICYLLLLVVFSIFVLTDLHPFSEKSLSHFEICILIWTGSLIIEEFRQMLFNDETLHVLTVIQWWTKVWNKFDTLMFGLFIMSVFLRFTLSGESFVWARRAYSITLGTFILRTWQFFYIGKFTGPKVIMIGEMLKDLLFFAMMFSVVLVCFGVITQANLYPNSMLSIDLLVQIVYIPYWQIYGELFLDNIEGNHQCRNSSSPQSDLPRCTESSGFVLFVLAVYLVFTNILLLNLLIAMFSSSFQRVQDNALVIWKFHQYSIVNEYSMRPATPPPLIFLNHLFRSLVYLVNYDIHPWWKNIKNLACCCSLLKRCLVNPSRGLNRRLTIYEEDSTLMTEIKNRETYLLEKYMN